MNDKTNRLVGWGIMRQLRMRSSSCPYRKINLTCYEDFSFSNEETNSFEIGWANQTTIISNSTLAQAFQYQTKDDFNSSTRIGDHGNYPDGGYIYEFRGRLADLQSNLSMLHQLEWIDRRTRAVIIQLSLYNPNVHLFTSITLLTEFLSTGGLEIRCRVEPIDFYVSLTSVFQLICTILYMMFILYFMFIEIQSLFRLKQQYFQQFWPVIEWGMIVCLWMGIALYIGRYREYSRISQVFPETNGYVYINLQYLTYLNDFLTYMYAFGCFFGTIRLLHLFRFHSRMYLFISTLQLGTKDLFGF